jgi:hypothetical protein
VLDDLEDGVDVGGFENGFHEGIYSIMAVENLENILVSTMRIQLHAGIIYGIYSISTTGRKRKPLFLTHSLLIYYEP